jgi:hypothetical protein
MGEMRNVYKILGGKPEGKRPLRHRGKDNIKMDLKRTGCKDGDWIHLIQDRVLWQALVNMVKVKVKLSLCF